MPRDSGPAGPVADYIKTLPPLQDDPASYYPEDTEESVGAETDDDASPEIPGLDPDTGEPTVGERPTAERDEKGRFKSADDKEAAQPAATATAAAPAASTAPAAAAEPAADPIAALMEQLPEEDRNAFQFSRALRDAQDPVALLAQQVQQAGIGDAFLAQLGVPAEMIEQLRDPRQAAGIDLDYEPTDFERVIQPHIDKLAKFPDSVRDIAAPVAQDAINREFGRLMPHIDASNVETQILRREVAALKEMMGIELPGVDRAAIVKALQDPKSTYDSAIDQVIGETFKTAVADYKQAVKARPETPGSESEGVSLEDLPRDRKEYGISSARDMYRQLFGGR